MNAISDIYAMGGTPLMAIAILGWPLELPPAVASQVSLAAAGVPRHSPPEAASMPRTHLCLAVTGWPPSKIKRNDAAARL